MQFSVEGRQTGPHNMARDCELLRRAELGEAGARVYDWDGPWVTLGSSQRPERDLLPGCPVPYAMRPTGGKGVLHGHDVTVGIGAPLRLLGDLDCRSVKAVYRILVRPFAAALRACGLPASLGEDTRFLKTAGKTTDCFAHVAACDVVDERTGWKLCGCALKLTETAALVQASIPNGPPAVDPALVFREPSSAYAPVWDSKPFAEALRLALEKELYTIRQKL